MSPKNPRTRPLRLSQSLQTAQATQIVKIRRNLVLYRCLTLRKESGKDGHLLNPLSLVLLKQAILGMPWQAVLWVYTLTVVGNLDPAFRLVVIIFPLNAAFVWSFWINQRQWIETIMSEHYHLRIY